MQDSQSNTRFSQTAQSLPPLIQGKSSLRNLHRVPRPTWCESQNRIWYKLPDSMRFVLWVSHPSAIESHLSNATYFYTNFTKNCNRPRKGLSGLTCDR